MAKRGKIVAVSVMVVGLMVLVGAGVSAWPRIEEEWWIYQLRNGDEAERLQSAEQLGALGSVKAVPDLVAAMLSASSVVIGLLTINARRAPLPLRLVMRAKIS